MLKLSKRNQWLQILIGGLIAAAGLIVIIIGIVDQSILSKALSIIIAIVLFLIGGAILINGVLVRSIDIFDGSIISGALVIAVGVLFVANTSIFDSLITMILATALIAYGVVALMKGIISIVKKDKVANIVIDFVIAVVAIALGIVIFCFKSQSMIVIYIITGALLLVAGGIELTYGILNMTGKGKKA